MAVVTEFTFPSSDGLHRCHVVEWLPEGEVRAVVQLSHGIAEYVARYDRLARFLTQHGFAVTGEDHLGHGGTVTDGHYGYFAAEDGWNKVARDIHTLHELAKGKFPGVPHFLYGHSMGSFLARTCLICWPGEWDGALLSGTGYTPNLVSSLGKLVAGMEQRRRGPFENSPILRKMAFGAYNRRIKPLRTENDWISRENSVVDDYNADPLCTIDLTAGLFRDMMGGLQFIIAPENLKKMNPDTPVYFFAGDGDPVGSYGKGVRKVAELFRRAGCRDVTVKLYPGGRHEMHNESNYRQVHTDILRWLEGHM